MSLFKLLVINTVYYGLQNVLQAELVPTSQDLILLLLGYLAVEMQSNHALHMYKKLSMVSMVFDFISLISVVMMIAHLHIPKFFMFIFASLFFIENYVKYTAIKNASRVIEDWDSVELGKV